MNSRQSGVCRTLSKVEELARNPVDSYSPFSARQIERSRQSITEREREWKSACPTLSLCREFGERKKESLKVYKSSREEKKRERGKKAPFYFLYKSAE